MRKEEIPAKIRNSQMFPYNLRGLYAKFVPVREDDLKPEMKSLMGKWVKITSYAGTNDDYGNYANEITVNISDDFALEFDVRYPYWVPLCDLAHLTQRAPDRG